MSRIRTIAVDDRGTAGLLRLLDDPVGQQRAEILALRPQRQEGDEDRAEDETGEPAEPADDDADEEVDRERDRERVRVDERARDREEPAGDSRVRGADPERKRLVAREAHARGDRRRLRVAHRAERPTRPPTKDEPRDRERDECDRPGEVVHPVVRRERAAEDVHVRDRAGELGDAEELDARAAARELLEALHGGRHRHRDREGREREVETRRDAAPGSRTRARRDRRRAPRSGSVQTSFIPPDDRAAELLVARHEDRRRVAADRHERAVAERDLARVAREDVETEERDQVDGDVRVVARLEVADERRQHRDERRRGPRTRRSR